MNEIVQARDDFRVKIPRILSYTDAFQEKFSHEI